MLLYRGDSMLPIMGTFTVFGFLAMVVGGGWVVRCSGTAVGGVGVVFRWVDGE